MRHIPRLTPFVLSLAVACAAPPPSDEAEPDGVDESDDAEPGSTETDAPPVDTDPAPVDTDPSPVDTDPAPVDTDPPEPEWGDPIELAPEQLEQWVWIDMPEMRCSDGSEGGFAVNFTEESRDLLIYLQGGGICFDLLTCLAGGARSSVGDDPLYTALDGPIRDHDGIFDRLDEANPFRHSSFVVVPHCTGDHHTGARVASYGVGTHHHVGYTNITRMLERVVPTFADASRVVLSGFSAGGVGIAANYHQLANAFESVGQPPPYLVIDAGPFMRPPFLETAGQQRLRTSWGLDDTIGTFCPTCLTSGFHEIYRVNAELHPGLRSSLVCSYGDSVVQLLYGVLNQRIVLPDELRAGLVDLADWGEDELDGLTPSRHRVFYHEGTGHGLLQFGAVSDAPGLLGFLEGQLGTGDWSSVRP